MLRSFSEVEGARIHADDGQTGSVRTLYFDDESWEVRHFVVATGPPLAGRDVLLPPGTVWEDGTTRASVLRTDLTKEEVKNAPGAESDPPVAAQQSSARLGVPPYPVMGGAAEIPAAMPADPRTLRAMDRSAADPAEDDGLPETGDPHLRSAEEVLGYRVRSSDGEIGHVEDLVVDAGDWVVRYVAVDTRNWLPGKKALVAASWVTGVSWPDAELFVCVDSIELKEAPAWNPNVPIDRVYEEKLHAYYGRTPYWVWQRRNATRRKET